MSRDTGSAIPRWVTIANLAAIVAALAIVIPRQVHAASLPAPANLCVCFRLPSGTGTAVGLTWSDPNDALAQGYFLQRSTSQNFDSGVQDIRIARNTYSFVDETMAPSGSFWYRIVSYSGTARSAPSNVVHTTNGAATATSPPAAPRDLVVAQKSGGMQLNWTDPATNESGELVERSGDQGTTWEWRAWLSLGSKSYFDNDPPAANPIYRVWTFNSKGLAHSNDYQVVAANAPSNVATYTGVASNVNVGGVSSMVSSALPAAQSQIASLSSQVAAISSNLNNVASVVPNAASLEASAFATVSSLSSQVGDIASNVNDIASIVPNANSLQASVQSMATDLQSQVTGIASIVPDVNKIQIFAGIYNTDGSWLETVWLWPLDCFGVPGTCNPPKPSNGACQGPIPFTTLEYCYMIVTG